MNKTAIYPAKILLPKTDDYTSWACIACDQFTSEINYWKTLEKQVEGKLTTLNLVLPEIYLNDDVDGRIERVNQNIKRYLSEGVFDELPEGYVLTVRSTPYVERRIGLIGKVDLEKYEYGKKTNALVRATEGTVEERIPPRLKVRKNADVEFPHVMILFDDEKREINEKLFEKRDCFKKLYSFDLNMNGGSIEGYFVDKSELDGKFEQLLDPDRLISKYGKLDDFMFAVGDGNHSLATAKTHWNNLKKTLTPEEIENHPARYALAEFVNIYDEGIYFEPIHRFIKGVDVKAFIDGLKKINTGEIEIVEKEEQTSFGEKIALADGISNVDAYVKEFLEKNGGVVDYIHGDANLKELILENENSLGIKFKKLDKKELFTYVSKKGAFPRKTFSMGEGIEKRYYLEGRRITK